MSVDGGRANFNNNGNWQRWWLYQPTILVTNVVIWPSYQMPMAEQLNSLTRLLILVVIVLYLLHYKDLSLYLLIIGIMLIIFTGLVLQNSGKIDNNNVITTPNMVNHSMVNHNMVNHQAPVISHLQVYNNQNDNWYKLKAYNRN